MHRHLASIIVIALSVCTGFADDSARELAGRVVDEKGQPVTGAKVAAIGSPPAGGEMQQLASTFTGTDGSFLFGKEVRQGFAMIVASKEGKCIDWGDLFLAGSTEPVLQLGPPAAIEGKIVDDAGKPVVGAAVALLLTMKESRAKQMFSPIRVEPFLAKTDDQGHFRFASLPKSATVAFDITAAGKARALVENLTPGQKGIRLVLPPEGRIEGAVVEKGTEKPLAGVTVHAIGSVTSGIYQQSAKTDKGGHFSMAGMSAGKYKVEIVGEGGSMPEWIGIQEKLQVENGKAATVKIEATRGGVLEVAVIDAASGRPIAVPASVDISPAADLRISKSDGMAPGEVAKLYLSPGKYVITKIWTTGYLYKEEKGKSFSVELGKTERAVVSVTAMPQIVLTVYDLVGRPVPAATGQIMPFVQSPKDVVADANGRLVLDPEDAGPWFCLVLVRHPKRNLAAVVVVAKDEKPPTVMLRAPTKVSGTVKDANGRPVVNALVQAQIDASHMGRFAIVAKARTDKDGRYQLEVPNITAQYAVSAHASGFSVAEFVLDQPEIAEGKEIVKDLVLKAADRKLRGLVMDAKSKPVPGAIITAIASATHSYPGSSVTDSSGHFVLENLDDERAINVYAHVPGRGWTGESTVKQGDQEVTIIAAPSHWD